MEKSKVYFTKNITSENLIKLYETLDKKLTGNIAIKLHSGEKGNQNYLHPEFLKDIIESLDPMAFIYAVRASEVHGEGFSYDSFQGEKQN